MLGFQSGMDAVDSHVHNRMLGFHHQSGLSEEEETNLILHENDDTATGTKPVNILQGNRRT